MDSDLTLGIPGFVYADLFEPARLADLHAAFDRMFAEAAPDAHARFAAYARSRGEGMSAPQKSAALLAAAPFVGAFVARLFGVEEEVSRAREEARRSDPLWSFRRGFVKRRLPHLVHAAPEEPALARLEAERVAILAIDAAGGDPAERAVDEERWLARGVVALMEIDDTARKIEKAGGAAWTPSLDARRERVRAALGANDASGEEAARAALTAVEAWLTHRRRSEADAVHGWRSLRLPEALDHAHLVQLRRPDPAAPELFVGPEATRRQRADFRLTDRRGTARDAEGEIDACMLCHDRDKDSCAKGLREPKSGSVKKNALGVPLSGCPLEEKIGEMHAMRREGELLAALALIVVDNPMCAGTGHRICNDCMKACIFQKQEPVNVPQVETRVLTEVLALPWGLEIYGFLTRFNPLNVERPFARPYRGKNVLVVGLGPAGYTLAHHLASEGFGVVAIDGLKIEPLPVACVGDDGAPRAVRDFGVLYTELDERVLLGFGGVSEYGITARWDKNFLTVLYVTLARSPLLKMFGGVRFGGTLTLDDAWALGFDHVAIAAGAGKPTLVSMKNNLARGIRKASDFLMGLQLTGAYKASSMANLQVSLPAIVIGGGLTAIDAATELSAYYLVQIEKTAERFALLCAARGEEGVRGLFDREEWETLERHLAHARELAAEREVAAREGRPADVQRLVASWGGVTLVYRKSLGDSPAYRLNHEEVVKGLEEGIRFVENASPEEALLDEHGAVRALRFTRKDGTPLELPARTVCVAAGTSPNVTCEREAPGTFALDVKGQFFQAHEAVLGADGQVTVTPAPPATGFFTSVLAGGRTVSFYGDNHPHYAGSVVRAMASAKHGYERVMALFPPEPGGAREADLRALHARAAEALEARVHAVTRLTDTIVEVVVHAPLAARRFEPGQFYRLQNYETTAPRVRVPGAREATCLAMEGLALTGAWTDKERGLLGTIVLELGGSSRMCALLRPGERVVLMGPTGAPTEIGERETVLLCGGGLGNAVLFSIARAMKARGCRVLYFAGYRRGEDLFKQDDIERVCDQVVWCTDSGAPIAPRREKDAHYRGNLVAALVAYARGELPHADVPLREVGRIIAIGSDRMMNAVREARHGVLAPHLDPEHHAIGSINSPMQCMMKEVCAQCLQKHRDPETGKEHVVFTCFNQDQPLDRVDFDHLRQRLRANSMQEKLTNAWLDELLRAAPELPRA